MSRSSQKQWLWIWLLANGCRHSRYVIWGKRKIWSRESVCVREILVLILRSVGIFDSREHAKLPNGAWCWSRNSTVSYAAYTCGRWVAVHRYLKYQFEVLLSCTHLHEVLHQVGHHANPICLSLGLAWISPHDAVAWRTSWEFILLSLLECWELRSEEFSVLPVVWIQIVVQCLYWQ